MKLQKVTFYSLLSFMLISLLIACTSFSLDDLKDLDENDLFNKAQLYQQSAVSTVEYKNTIQIYQYYIDTFNNRPDRIMEARYEIGYINYYLKNYDEAEKIFRNLIYEYDNGGNQYTPQWIYVLSNQLKDKIVQIRTEKILEESKKTKKK